MDTNRTRVPLAVPAEQPKQRARVSRARLNASKNVLEQSFERQRRSSLVQYDGDDIFAAGAPVGFVQDMWADTPLLLFNNSSKLSTYRDLTARYCVASIFSFLYCIKKF